MLKGIRKIKWKIWSYFASLLVFLRKDCNKNRLFGEPQQLIASEEERAFEDALIFFIKRHQETRSARQQISRMYSMFYNFNISRFSGDYFSSSPPPKTTLSDYSFSIGEYLTNCSTNPNYLILPASDDHLLNKIYEWDARLQFKEEGYIGITLQMPFFDKSPFQFKVAVEDDIRRKYRICSNRDETVLIKCRPKRAEDRLDSFSLFSFFYLFLTVLFLHHKSPPLTFT